MKRKKLALLSGSIGLMVIVAVLPFVGACAPPAPEEFKPTPAPAPAPKAEPIKIGTLLNFSGPIADMGPRFLQGIEMALEEENYEAAGRPIELIVEDAASDPTVTLERLKKLYTSDGVNIVIGPLMGDGQMAVGPYAAEKKILITTIINGMFPNVEFGNWVMYPTTTIAQQRMSGWYVYDELGARTIVTIGSDYAGGYGYIDGAVYGFEEKGGEVVQQIWAPIGTADFAPYIASVEEADALVVFLSSGEDAARLLLAYNESGRELPQLFQLIHEVFTPEMLAEFGEGIVGLKAQSTYVWNRDDPINNQFVENFRAKYGTVPSIEQNSYTLAKMVVSLLEATGGDNSFDKLWPALLALKMDTPQGPLSFDTYGIALTDIYIIEIQEKAGDFVPVILKVYPQSTADPRLE
ncbi:MAG: hypothetical protein CL875_04720 [Dehalococcoidales bacterium]|nr:hypothetical protein [Dehalococcoidales bacterium]